MRRFIFLLLILLPFYSNAQEMAVRKTIETFFEAFHAKDSLQMKSVCHQDLLLQSILEGAKGTKLVTEDPKDFYKAITSFPKDLKFEERLLEYKIQSDGAMAHAWTPYMFLINGKVVHTGVNSFTLLLENGQWKIVHIIDTRRKK